MLWGFRIEFVLTRSTSVKGIGLPRASMQRGSRRIAQYVELGGVGYG